MRADWFNRSMCSVAGAIVVMAGCGAPTTADFTSSPNSSEEALSPLVTTTPVGQTSTTPDGTDCGRDLPVFLADDSSSDPLNTEGNPGPGPDSRLASTDQMVSHWIGEFATHELRWPADDDSSVFANDELDWALSVAGYPAVVDLTDPNRIRLFLRLDQKQTRCSILEAVAYGENPDAVLEEGGWKQSLLRPRNELEAYRVRVLNQSVASLAGHERPEGRCAIGVESEVNDFGEVSIVAAYEVVSNFLADRASGSRAQQCLTPAALASYEAAEHEFMEAASDNQYLDNILSCLFACGDGLSPVFDAEPVLQDHGYGGFASQVSAIVERSEPGDPARRVRETYVLVVALDATAPGQVLIQSVIAEPESYVDFGRATELVRGFLDDLAQGRFDEACCLFNEGVAQEVEDKLGDVWNRPIDELLEEFCLRAYCDAPFEIVGSGEVRVFQREIIVRFETDQGALERSFWVGSFEGVLTLGNLPPER